MTQKNGMVKMEEVKASFDRQAIVMAMATVFQRLTQLPKVDLQEIYELAKELPKAKGTEEIEAIRVAMVEILDQRDCGAHAFEQVGERPERLQKWVDFVAARVQQARKAAGLTQIQLAEKSGLPQSHISRIESAKLSPSRATLGKIAKAIGRPLSELDPSA